MYEIIYKVTAWHSAGACHRHAPGLTLHGSYSGVVQKNRTRVAQGASRWVGDGRTLGRGVGADHYTSGRGGMTKHTIWWRWIYIVEALTYCRI